MSPAHIVARVTKTGKRYIVRYRLGRKDPISGKHAPLHHAGSFRSLKDARARRDLVTSEIAAGRNPADTIRALSAPTPQRVTMLDRHLAFEASRLDVGSKTLALYRNARDQLGALADLEPNQVTAADVQARVAELARTLSTGTIQHYLSTWRQVLDFCEIDPNPARSKLVKLPAATSDEIAPPSTKEWLAIRAHVRKRSLLPLRLEEACGPRMGAEILKLTWGDVDFVEGRLRISKARTKGRTAGQRWLPVPPPLLDEIDELVPLEDRRHNRRVFDQVNDQMVRDDMAKACTLAGIATYSPHQLRHRRISLWFRHGIDEVTAKTWAGHTRASMTQDVYGHVIVAGDDEWRGFWLATYTAERLPGTNRDAQVMHEPDPEEADPHG